MARIANTDKELSKINSKIEHTTEALARLKEQRKAIIEQKEQAELKELYEIVKDSGKNISDIIAELKAN